MRSTTCPGLKKSYLPQVAASWKPGSHLRHDPCVSPKKPKKMAMEYSPRNANPYISRVDAGTIELVRSDRRSRSTPRAT